MSLFTAIWNWVRGEPMGDGSYKRLHTDYALGRLLFARNTQLIRKDNVGDHLLENPLRYQNDGEAKLRAIISSSLEQADRFIKCSVMLRREGKLCKAEEFWRKFLKVIATMVIDVLRQNVFVIASPSACAGWMLLILCELGVRRRRSLHRFALVLCSLLQDVPTVPKSAEVQIEELTDRLFATYYMPHVQLD